MVDDDQQCPLALWRERKALDHLGIGAPDARGDRINNGAVDNATGTAALIEMGRAFANGKRPDRSVVFLAVTAEEKGLLGSEYYAANPLYPLATTVAVLNGTVSETGVAADYADKIEKDGYNLGVVTNTTSSYANSIVMYTKGNEAAAADVAKSVNIADTGVITPQIASLTENADVTVVVGLDHGSVP